MLTEGGMIACTLQEPEESSMRTDGHREKWPVRQDVQSRSRRRRARFEMKRLHNDFSLSPSANG